MPDRIIRTIHGPTGGLLVIVGAYLLGRSGAERAGAGTASS